MDENMIEFKNLEHDSSFISEHSKEFSVKYPKKFIAVFNGQLIFVGDSFDIVLDKVKDEASDINDFPYFAVCLLINAGGIWTHDPHFYKQNKYKIFTNIDMLGLIEESSE